jgi:hypothetical protein
MQENNETEVFAKDLFEEINAEFLTSEEGTTPEQVFTEYCLRLLAEAGETENYHVCYDEKQGKKGTDHKINAYSLYENYETLDLFITIYSNIPEPVSITKADCEKAFKRLIHFFKNTITKGYVNEIEESSEIFDLANTLFNTPEVKEYLTRINIFLLTNGVVHSDLNPKDSLAGFQIYYRVIDINYLYNISEKSGIPIEINFEDMGYQIPCISAGIGHEEYESYLLVIPGMALAEIYEQYGPRLLEQNVRTFLQFTGKINKGIRKTIIEEPHMFLAFNNGIAATADDVFLNQTESVGRTLSRIVNFQIVNGGQTTASIYHTWKKNNADITEIKVPVKLTIISNKEKIAETVGRIAEYANTQNKVSASDLSSNREGFMLLDKISRTCWAPPLEGCMQQTRWFFERARGQYRNERNRNGYTPAKKKAFDLQNPRNQLVTKELLAKYVNCFDERTKGSKIVVGPHYVVRGSQKNYVQFLSHNFENNPSQSYFEDLIAKAILFKTAEKIYGIKPNAIGDLRYITVPYAIGLISYFLKGDIDLYKIWRSQQVPKEIEDPLKMLMIKIEIRIKNTAPGALYGEYAKKEECWNDLKSIAPDLVSPIFTDFLQGKDQNRMRETNDLEQLQREQCLKEIHELGAENWKKVYLWCKATDNVPLFYKNIAHTIGIKIHDNITLSNKEILAGFQLMNLLSEKKNTLEEILSE